MKQLFIIFTLLTFLTHHASAVQEADVCINVNFDARVSFVKTKFKENLPNLHNSITYTQVPRGLIVSIPQENFFYKNSAKLTNEGMNLLDTIAEILKLFNNNCAIENHTDEKMTSESGYQENWEISIHRANVLTEYLITHGNVDSERLYPIGFGEIMPFYGNVSKENFTDNRIDFVIFDYSARR